ncbi:hypothetical protein MAH1_36690 [Sessilibacter sp. MAH1]
MGEYTASDINVINLAKMSVTEVIKILESHTLMFLPEKHIGYAATFISGYLCGKGSGEDYEVMSGFDRYIERKFNITATHGWARNIYNNSTDPHSALEYFFVLFAEYLR